MPEFEDRFRDELNVPSRAPDEAFVAKVNRMITAHELRQAICLSLMALIATGLIAVAIIGLGWIVPTWPILLSLLSLGPLHLSQGMLSMIGLAMALILLAVLLAPGVSSRR